MTHDPLSGACQNPRVADPDIAQPATGVIGLLEIRRWEDDHGIVLALEGELDLGSAPELERELREVEATPARRLLIDLRRLTFMDCTGIAILTRAQQSAHAAGCRLALRSSPGQVLRLFQLTGSVERFTFVDE